MLDEIMWLETAARVLEPDLERREQYLEQAIAYSQEYLEGVADSPTNSALGDGRGFYDSPITGEGIAIEQADVYLPQRGDADIFNERLTKRIQKDGRIYISSTRMDGKFVLHMAISSFRTHLSDIDQALDVLKWTAEKLVKEK
jgi:hypothetical protein